MNNLPLRIAVIGAGYWGKNLVRNFYELGVLEWCCDVSAASLDAAAKTYPDLKTTGSTQTVLENDAVQAVVIATPAVTHYDLARKALLKGKDVFVEKPIALVPEEALELVELAREKERILMVGHVLEYHPAIQKLRNIIDDGLLGKVQYLYSNRLNFGRVRDAENVLWSFAPHDIAVILRIIGKLPDQVIAVGSAYVRPEIADVTVTQLLFRKDVSAHIFVSWLHPFKEQRLVVVGSEKMAVFDDVNKKLLLYDQRATKTQREVITEKREAVTVDYAQDEPLRLECEAFLESIRTRKQPLTDGSSALRVLCVLDAAQKSLMKNGEIVCLERKIFEPAGAVGFRFKG